jgi:hypothetical protein
VEVALNKHIVILGLCAALIGPIAAQAALVAAATIPDGTYTVTVTKIVDNKHIEVTLDNGNTTQLAAGRDTVDFSKVKENDQLKMSIGKGSVLVFLDLTTH